MDLTRCLDRKTLWVEGEIEVRWRRAIEVVNPKHIPFTLKYEINKCLLV